MSRVTIWQCRDWCCEERPYSLRWWMVRSRDFDLYENVSTWETATTLASSYVRKAA